MSIIDRIKHLKPKQWAMIVGGVGALGLGIDYYRRREGSLVGRAWEKIHPAPPPPPAPPAQQRRPAPSRPSMPGAQPYDMGQMMLPEMPMGGEVIVEETPGYYYAPYAPYYPWARSWWPHEHGFGPHHEFHGRPEFHGAHPAQHAQHPSAQPQQHGAPPQQQPQQQHGTPPPSGHHHA
jgi:hypothetical protein